MLCRVLLQAKHIVPRAVRLVDDPASDTRQVRNAGPGGVVVFNSTALSHPALIRRPTQPGRP